MGRMTGSTSMVKLGLQVGLAAVLTTWLPPASAQSLDLNQYLHTTWRVRETFPVGRVGVIAQTTDGYLWLGSTIGMVRFDGVRAVRWRPPEDQPLPSEMILDLV